MKVKIGSIWNSLEALKTVRGFKLDAVKAYHFKKLCAEIQVEIDAVDAVRMDLVKKHGSEIMNAEGKGTGQFEVKPYNPGYQAFITELNTIFDKEIDLVELENAQLDVNDLEGNKIETTALSQLDWLIV